MTAVTSFRAWLALAAIVAVLAPRSARCAPPGHLDVSLRVAACAPIDARAVRRVLAIELRTSVPGASLGEAAGASRIEVSCQGRLLMLQVHDAITGKTLSRRIDVRTMPRRGRDRLVALAAMELLVASWVELQTTTRSNIPGVDASASPTMRRSARAVATRHLPRRRWRETAVGFGAVAIEDHGTALGLGARWMRDHERGIGFSVGALLDTANVSVPLGHVRVRAAQVSASMHLHDTWRTLRWRAAAGGRLGLVTMSGAADDPDTTDSDVTVGVSFGPLLRLDGERALGPVVTTVSAESGYHARGVGGLVNGVRAVGVRGPWVLMTVGVGARW